MKTALAILFITGIMVQQLAKTIIVTGFLLNRDYIVKNLCENRNNPGVHCNGKCHLHKELAKDDARQGSEKQNISQNDELAWETNQGNPSRIHFEAQAILVNKIIIAHYTATLSALLRPPCEMV